MKVQPIKTHRITDQDRDLYVILDRYLTSFEEGSILAITSKIVSICQGRMVRVEDADKQALIESEADRWLSPSASKYHVSLTIKDHLLIPMAGVDESNANGHYILWPRDPQRVANEVRVYLSERFARRQVGVIITDSKTTPLRWGVTGVAIAHSGFLALNDYIGQPDLFGRALQMTKVHVADALAAAAVLVMGEGSEQTPLAVIDDVPFVTFQERDPSPEELQGRWIDIEDDLYAPLLQGVEWHKGASEGPKSGSFRGKRRMSTEIERFLGRPTARIMLLGTFHFEDRGVDRYKPQAGFDVFSSRRQAEIAEVVERLAGFRPSKIAIERRPQDQDEIDTSYSAYLEDRFELPGDEIYQLGFRLAKQLRHDRVYCVNAWGRYYEPTIDVEAHVREHGLDREYLNGLLSPHTPQTYAQEHGQEHLLSQWQPRFEAWYGHWDQLKTQLCLREILLRTNAEESILKGHGHYLVDWFKVGVNGSYPGVDWVTAWYNRNLRIFANLQRITQSPEERILLIIGGGHLAILRHCVLASPEYDLVEVHEHLALDDKDR